MDLMTKMFLKRHGEKMQRSGGTNVSNLEYQFQITLICGNAFWIFEY